MKTTMITGILLVLLGILFLGPTFGLFTLANIWPTILLLVGVGFFMAFFAAPKLYGLLMPGAVLLISSVPLLICALSGDWRQMSQLWPIFILSISIGFFLMYFLGKRQNGLFIPALVLLAVGIISFLIFNYIKYVFPILFLAAGLILIFGSLISRRKAKSAT
ncbi:hypothetical protein JW998_12500 [candidate division KSB1 bacterium]|nr:hypothetical protein [candidate division KSB1 bacterium]